MMKTPRFSRKVLLILVLLLLVTTTVYANAGIGFLFPALIHVLIGNVIIGLIEAFFIQKVFKISVGYAFIVLGNYVSSILGYVALVVGFSNSDFGSISALPITLILLFIASVLIEWPFFAWAVKERIFGFSKTSFKYTLYAQFVSYALLVPFYFTFSDDGRLPPGVFMSDDFIFLSRNAYSYRMRPHSDGGGGGSYDGYSIPENYSITQFGRYKATTSKDSIVFFAVWAEDSTTTFSVVLDSTGNMHLLKFTGDPSGLWLPPVAPVVTGQQQKYRELVKLAETFYNNKEYKNSAEYYDRTFKIHKGTSDDYYNAACSWALAGDKTKALEYLNQSVDLGWLNINHLKKDTDLSSLHQTKEWEELINKLKKKLDEYESRLNKPLLRELEAIYESDQKYRMMMDSVEKKFGWDSKEMKELWTKQNEVDFLNLIRTKEIIKEYGYPGTSLVGRQSSTAWLVIQHADLKTQEEYLPILQDAANKGELNMSSYALLVDRVRMGKGEKQLYGSQIQTKNGKYEIYPIEDEPNVNKRRAKMELGPLEDYVKRWGIEYKVPTENRK